jgi:predicted AlkP superfamily phosphohydrolase/phosphomutase
LIDIPAIAGAIKGSRVKITDHADEEARADQVSIEQVLDSVPSGEIIEQYIDDKPYPSCLVYSDSNGPLHSVWAYNQANSWAVLITVYRPDPQRWIDWRRRKPKP